MEPHLGGPEFRGVRVTLLHIGRLSVGGTCLGTYYKLLLVFYLF